MQPIYTRGVHRNLTPVLSATERAMATKRADAIRKMNSYADLAAEHLCKLTFYSTHTTLGLPNVRGWLDTINNKCIRQIYEANKRDRDAKKKWLNAHEIGEALRSKDIELLANTVSWLSTLRKKQNYVDVRLTTESIEAYNAVSFNVNLFLAHCYSGKPINESALRTITLLRKLSMVHNATANTPNLGTMFTGQAIVGNNGRYDEILCPECGKTTHLGAAFIDPYHSSGSEKYVHYRCLSKKRRNEISTEVNSFLTEEQTGKK